METKHTKGKWVISCNQNLYSTIKNEHGVRIAEVKSYEGLNFNDASLDERKANEKLISSAPELLEALIELYESLPDGYKHKCLPKVRKAIKKATN